MLKRKLRKSEIIKEAKASSIIVESMFEMFPHQLELLSDIALKIISVKPVNR